MLCPYYYYGYQASRQRADNRPPLGLGFGRFGWLGDFGQASA